MALGRRQRARQGAFWIATQDLPRASGHPFYEKLNRLLDEAKFDEFVESLCAPYDAAGTGRPGIPPGVYFRMLLIGYFEGIESQRAIAWRCADSLSLKVKGKTTAVDATLLEANTAMKSIVRRDTGADWTEYLTKLAEKAGIENPTDEDLRRFDKNRKGKKVSNKEWVSKTDPAARIMKMKDGRTHLAYKAEHAIELDSGKVLAATIHHGDRADGDSLMDSLIASQANLILSGSDAAIREVPADKGYHKAETLAWCRSFGIRTYIPERETKHRRKWKDNSTDWQEAVYSNRRRVTGARGKRLQRLRSEYVERSFAHMCETGGARWTRESAHSPSARRKPQPATTPAAKSWRPEAVPLLQRAVNGVVWHGIPTGEVWHRFPNRCPPEPQKPSRGRQPARHPRAAGFSLRGCTASRALHNCTQ